MSTHNIGFYEDLTRIIFQLSSNIIKYALISLIVSFLSTKVMISVPSFIDSN